MLKPDTYPGAISELALAAITGRVPGREVRKHLEQGKADDEWLQMLADLYDIVRPI